LHFLQRNQNNVNINNGFKNYALKITCRKSFKLHHNNRSYVQNKQENKQIKHRLAITLEHTDSLRLTALIAKSPENVSQYNI